MAQRKFKNEGAMEYVKKKTGPPGFESKKDEAETIEKQAENGHGMLPLFFKHTPVQHLILSIIFNQKNRASPFALPTNLSHLLKGVN